MGGLETGMLIMSLSHDQRSSQMVVGSAMDKHKPLGELFERNRLYVDEQPVARLAPVLILTSSTRTCANDALHVPD